MSSYLIHHEVTRRVRRPATTLCEVCEAREAHYTCRLCGRRICEKCFNKEKKICRVCLETLCDECGKRASVDTCVICGKKICRECSVELDYARRICLSCHRRLEDPKRYIEERTSSVLNELRKHWGIPHI